MGTTNPASTVVTLKPSTVKVDTKTSTVVSKAPETTIEQSNATIVTKNKATVQVHPRKYVISPNDVYLVKRDSNPEQWFLDILNKNLEDTYGPTMDSFRSDIEKMEVGVNTAVTEIENTNLSLNAKVDSVKSELEGNIGAVLEVAVTKVTAAQASAMVGSTVASYFNDNVGAMVDKRVSTVAKSAYAAAKDTTYLSVELASQQKQLSAAFGSISELEKQVDGVIETHFISDGGGTNPDGPNRGSTPNIDLTDPLYVSWLSPDVRASKTGDTYVLYEENTVLGEVVKSIVGSWKFGKAQNADVPRTDAQGYQWVPVTDSLAMKAYTAALNAQGTADGKISSYIQTTVPPSSGVKDIGDLWVNPYLTPASDPDTDPLNLDPSTGFQGGDVFYRYNGATWDEVSDKNLKASIDFTNKVVADLDKGVKAVSQLTHEIDTGHGTRITGWKLDSTASESTFDITADKFIISDPDVASPGDPGRELLTYDKGNHQLNVNGSFKATKRGTNGRDYAILDDGDLKFYKNYKVFKSLRRIDSGINLRNGIGQDISGFFFDEPNGEPTILLSPSEMSFYSAAHSTQNQKVRIGVESLTGSRHTGEWTFVPKAELVRENNSGRVTIPAYRSHHWDDPMAYPKWVNSVYSKSVTTPRARNFYMEGGTIEIYHRGASSSNSYYYIIEYKYDSDTTWTTSSEGNWESSGSPSFDINFPATSYTNRYERTLTVRIGVIASGAYGFGNHQGSGPSANSVAWIPKTTVSYESIQDIQLANGTVNWVAIG